MNVACFEKCTLPCALNVFLRRPSTQRVDLRANGKIVRIDILDGGTGYTQPPKIRFNRTVALDAASLSNNNLFLDEDQYGTKLAKPEYEVIVEDGTVQRVNIKSPGAGLFDGTFNW